MSGIEVAGLVLGAIPILVSALEAFIKGVSTIKKWMRYKTELKNLLRALITDVLVEKLGKNRQSNESSRIGYSARTYGYLQTVDDMNNAIEEFKRRLKLGKDGQIQFNDTNTLKTQYKILKFSLSWPAYGDLIERVRKDNYTLSQLTRQSLALEAPRACRCRRAPDFKTVRDCARVVYNILRSGWKCSCVESHCVNLRLEARIDAVDSQQEEYEAAATPPRF
ncbi:hypothetical protein D8B26_000726 [Coccidioides posadasii str. Silveira]|uniref:uncharacterized protein n=1 Tax=Coccidioides posadasii (strain RMSCC 757 / Silveira) TaxID=443226 RepID=UPI001BED9ADF|nr:hypothetical protein D8B26_000726 [Coccidioides posadasii str. Silveira]